MPHWECHDGELYSPEDPYHGYTPGHLRQLHWLHELASAQRQALAKLKAAGTAPAPEQPGDGERASGCPPEERRRRPWRRRGARGRS